MVELIGDNCEPSDLTVPTYDDTTAGARSGSIKMSGSKLHVWTGSVWEIVTSA